MSYDVHITRAEFWAENTGRRIPLGEWVEAASRDPRLDHRGEGVVVAVGGGADGEDLAIIWHDGDVYATAPDEAGLLILRSLAGTLEARVQGDDGELY